MGDMAGKIGHCRQIGCFVRAKGHVSFGGANDHRNPLVRVTKHEQFLFGLSLRLSFF
jgi:hypothetical protein